MKVFGNVSEWPASFVQIFNIVDRYQAEGAEVGGRSTAKPSQLACSKHVAHEGDQDALDEKCKWGGCGRSVKYALPEIKKLCYNDNQDVVYLVERGLPGAGDYSGKIHVSKEISQVGWEIEDHKIYCGAGQRLFCLQHVQRVEAVGVEAESKS